MNLFSKKVQCLALDHPHESPHLFLEEANIDRNWELTPFLRGARLLQPILFIAGEEDGVTTLYRNAFDDMEEAVPNLKKKALVPGAGHWVQQERPKEVNELIVEFLLDL